MKKAILLIAAILTVSSAAFADVKIKSKQTMSGQVTENTVYIKGKRQRSEIMGGMSVSLTQCDLGRDLQINPAAKTYMVSLYNDGSGVAAQPTSGTKQVPVTRGGTMYITTTTRDTGERKQMFGYTARHIIQTIETDSSPDACSQSKTKMEMDMWVIDAEFGLSCQHNRNYTPYNAKNSGGCTDKIVSRTSGTGKTGYPVWQKMTTYDASGKESYTMVQEVVELSKATLDAALFDVPAGYREVSDSQQLYASASTSGYGNTASAKTPSSSSAFGSSLKTTASSANTAANPVAAKREGTIRVGLANVKTGSVGESVSASDLSAAVANSLGEYFKGTKVEVVTLDAKLPSAQAAEAREKQCDYIVNATASHKKGGGGGFGFGKLIAQTVGQTGIGHTGSVAGNIAGQMATTAIVTAGSLSGDVKKKDEVTLEIKVAAAADNSAVLSTQFKAKAKSDGDDIISVVVEQAAQAILDAIGK